MAIPNLHAPDEEWAEERVKRMMEPDKPIEPLSPGDQVTADKSTDSSDETEIVADSAADSSSDFDINSLTADESKPQAETSEDAESVVADPKTDAAVDDVLKADGDEALKAQDAAAEPNIIMKPNMWERLKNDIADWWDNPRERYITLGILLLLVIAVFSFPASRLYAMNLVGFRGDITVDVVDGGTKLPLQSATVSLAGQTGSTDGKGVYTFKRAHLGAHKLVVDKAAFAKYSTSFTITSGAHTIPNIQLKAVGTQYSFVLMDYVSGKPVMSGKASSGKSNAQADKTGKVVLTVEPSSNSMLDVQIGATRYRTENVSIKNGTKTVTAVKLVPAAKDVFISKQTGKYDLYTADLDGKNRKVLLAATGTENQDIAVSVSPDGSEAALVSTRDDQHDAQGYLLSALTLVNVSTGASTTIDHAESVDLLGWSGTKLVYEQTVAGASSANPNRERISSYDYQGSKKLQLTSANYFNGYVLIGNGVYYAVSSTDPSATASAYKINIDGTSKLTIASQEIWTVVRTGYNSLSLQTPSSWLSYTVGATSAKVSTAPVNYTPRSYTDNADSSMSLWVDNRDGKGALLSYSSATGKDTTVTAQAGLTTPVRWINSSTILYRVSTQAETADYIVSTLGGQPQKISDVTSTQ